MPVTMPTMPTLIDLDTLLDVTRRLPQAEKIALASLLLQQAAQPRSKETRRQPGTLLDQGPVAKPGRGRLGPSTRTMAERHAIYASPAWRSAYRPSQEELHCYILGCEQSRVLAALLGEPIFKVGTAQMGRLNLRVAELNRQRYGSLMRAADGSGYSDEQGFNTWTAPPKLQLRPPHPLGPVRVGTETFIVRLPVGLSHGVFESALNRALRPASLRSYVDSDEGRAALARRGLDPDQFLRASLDRPTGLPVAAIELILLRPQADGPALAGILEDIVIDHVLGLRMRRAA
ncbi:hypothetical protein P7D22_17390 [Lichenihabitans sp. Uapishka_5]|uniref:hypothetical protein n=1 Tax=Lichenihabitans sp. Uapishka_5 TaxID=3037302 RepID=UPI0029E7EA38|nr:hypothetical protein [Lichenihabitans sp. Uapishka_5]MDX7952941.1 hypothetical protein [Lichenihabitans sp. Uapishka_5]